MKFDMDVSLIYHFILFTNKNIIYSKKILQTPISKMKKKFFSQHKLSRKLPIVSASKKVYYKFKFGQLQV